MTDAPEKIYILIKGDFVYDQWFKHPIDNEDVEYIRSDLFLELRAENERLLSALEANNLYITAASAELELLHGAYDDVTDEIIQVRQEDERLRKWSAAWKRAAKFWRDNAWENSLLDWVRKRTGSWDGGEKIN